MFAGHQALTPTHSIHRPVPPTTPFDALLRLHRPIPCTARFHHPRLHDLGGVVQAPIVPTAKHPGDTSNFENYPEPSDEDGKATGHDPYRHLFLSF